jgi:microcystin-dependent protein
MNPTLSEIRMFAGNFAPLYWKFCNGQLMSIAENTALFSLVGTIYGGDGQVTFGLPDLRGRMPVGTGTGPGLPNVDLGEMAGSENVTALSTNLPAHMHSISYAVPATEEDANLSAGAGNVLATAAFNAYATGSGVTTGPIMVTLNPNGSNAPIPVLQPYLAINFIICVEGIYPSRN